LKNDLLSTLLISPLYKMAGSDEAKKAAIPAWQRAGIDDVVSSPEVAQESTAPKPDEYTLEAARKWLDDEAIRNEPRDRKIAFLKDKGLQNEAIQSLLGYEKPAVVNELKTVHDSTTDVVQKEPAEKKPEEAGPVASTHDSRRDIPPIITYPEFLIRPQKPPPLVTAQRLIYAAYAFAGISTLTYGASKFIVQPMLESLTSAREELASTALQDLEKLNAKLETTVSHVPYIASSQAQKEGEYRDEDEESVDSDPTELFHRDIGIQTSPPRSRSPSISSDLKSKDPAIQHVSTLSSLLSNLKSLNPPEESDPFPTTDKLKDTVSSFQTYLNTLQFSGSTFRTDYNSIYTSTSVSDNKKVKNPNDTDEAAKLKAEIRAMKGVFLSSRNFPGRPAVVGLKS
jgi:hypothetical protein